MRPSFQRNALQVRRVPKPQMSSPFGSGTSVSAKPTASPRSLIPANPFIQLFGPPSVPRSNLSPSTFIAARPFTSAPEAFKTPYWVNPTP